MANEETTNIQAENTPTLEEQIDEATLSEKLEKKAKKEKRKNKRRITFEIFLILVILLLINIYIVLSIFYKGENFTVTLDSEYGRESGLVIYEDPNNKYTRTFLRSDDIEFFTDISINWLPEDIDNEGNGSHNGRNYIAYTFYAENMGQDVINYWTTIEIDDVVKNVDEAIRVMTFKNGERVVYAKNNRETGEPEPDTVAFKDEDTIMLDLTENFRVGDIDKWTVVIWVEGDDPECLDDLIGGEIKMHMTLTEEHILQEDETPQQLPEEEISDSTMTLYAMNNKKMDSFDKSVEAIRLSHDFTDLLVTGGALSAVWSFNAQVAAGNAMNPEMFSKTAIWIGNGLIALSCLAVRQIVKESRMRDEREAIEALKYVKAIHICMQEGYLDSNKVGKLIQNLYNA